MYPHSESLFFFARLILWQEFVLTPFKVNPIGCTVFPMFVLCIIWSNTVLELISKVEANINIIFLFKRNNSLIVFTGIIFK